MKRTLLTVCALVGASTIGASAAAATATPPPKKDACAALPSKAQQAKCETYSHSAPGDEYFGRMKMSYLGINNTFHDEAIRAGASTTDSNVINKVNFADEALRAWMQRYPGDPQLSRSYYLAIQVYKKIFTEDAQNKAWNYMQLEIHQFPASYFGKIVKKNVAIGFTEHYYAPAELCPTLPPSASPSPAGNRGKNTPTPAPTDTPTASPTPTPTPRPGQPKVEIIIPPCIQPTPVPTETPSALPSTSPSPAAAPVPVAAPSPSPSPGPSATPSAVPAPSPSPSALASPTHAP